MKVGFVLAALWAGAVLQLAWARHLGIYGAQPDFLLVVVSCSGFCLDRTPGTLVGFGAGVFHGALAGANLTHYVISRCVAGFVASWSRNLRFEMTPLTVAIFVACVTVVAQITLMFIAAPSGIAGFLGDTIGSAVYNGVIAIPVYALFRRILNPTVR